MMATTVIFLVRMMLGTMAMFVAVGISTTMVSPTPSPPRDGVCTMIQLTKVAIVTMTTKTDISLPLPTAKATVSADFFPLSVLPHPFPITKCC